jgi:phenazine biosynthesis protein phzE
LNNEDDFAFMIGHILRVMKAEAKVVDSLTYDPKNDDSALFIVGPGPGDPSDMSHPRMRKIQEILKILREKKKPILGVCLGHQSLAIHLGLKVERQASSTQGMQRKLCVAGQERRLGFYNSFSPVFDQAARERTDLKFDLDEKDRIVALFGHGLAGFQFHPESVMSEGGAALIYETIRDLVAGHDRG